MGDACCGSRGDQDGRSGRDRGARRLRRGDRFAVFRDLCGHGIGRSIHEEPSVCNYYDPRERTRLTHGLVIALEPIISAGAQYTRLQADGWTLSSADGRITAHYEHTIVITCRQPLLLTAA